jgi:hypothetical protein
MSKEHGFSGETLISLGRISRKGITLKLEEKT